MENLRRETARKAAITKLLEAGQYLLYLGYYREAAEVLALAEEMEADYDN